MVGYWFFQPICFLNPFSENCVRARHLRALRLSLKGISTFAQAPKLWTVRDKSFPCLRSQSLFGCCHSPGTCQGHWGSPVTHSLKAVANASSDSDLATSGQDLIVPGVSVWSI